MNIILRNFLRLLRAGAFATDEEVEPMSAWKWRQMAMLAQKHGVAALCHDGTLRLQSQFFLQLPPDVDLGANASERLNSEPTPTLGGVGSYESEPIPTLGGVGPYESSVARLMKTLGEQHFRPMLKGGPALAMLYPVPSHRREETALTVFFPFATQGKKADEWARREGTSPHSLPGHRLTYGWQGLTVEHHHRLARLKNKLNNHALRQYIDQALLESQATHITIDHVRIETVPPTLQLFSLLIDVAHALVENRLRLWLLTDVGIFLRHAGHNVDFVRLQEWTDGLGLQRIMGLTATLLVKLLGFTPDELPFAEPDTSKQALDIAVSIGMAHNNGFRHILSYSPSEGFASIVSSVKTTLSSIEE